MKEIIEKNELINYWCYTKCPNKKTCKGQRKECQGYSTLCDAPFRKVPYMAFGWDGWHDAKEQLPPEKEDTGFSDLVLVTAELNDGKTTLEIAECYVSEKRWVIPEYTGDEYHVTAWQELPDPYYNPRKEVKELADKIGIHTLYAIVKEMRGE